RGELVLEQRLHGHGRDRDRWPARAGAPRLPVGCAHPGLASLAVGSVAVQRVAVQAARSAKPACAALPAAASVSADAPHLDPSLEFAAHRLIDEQLNRPTIATVATVAPRLAVETIHPGPARLAATEVARGARGRPVRPVLPAVTAEAVRAVL